MKLLMALSSSAVKMASLESSKKPLSVTDVAGAMGVVASFELSSASHPVVDLLSVLWSGECTGLSKSRLDVCALSLLVIFWFHVRRTEKKEQILEAVE